jgi:hypothetical protein
MNKLLILLGIFALYFLVCNNSENFEEFKSVKQKKKKQQKKQPKPKPQPQPKPKPQPQPQPKPKPKPEPKPKPVITEKNITKNITNHYNNYNDYNDYYRGNYFPNLWYNTYPYQYPFPVEVPVPYPIQTPTQVSIQMQQPVESTMPIPQQQIKSESYVVPDTSSEFEEVEKSYETIRNSKNNDMIMFGFITLVVILGVTAYLKKNNNF